MTVGWPGLSSAASARIVASNEANSSAQPWISPTAYTRRSPTVGGLADVLGPRRSSPRITRNSSGVPRDGIADFDSTLPGEAAIRTRPRGSHAEPATAQTWVAQGAARHASSAAFTVTLAAPRRLPAPTERPRFHASGRACFADLRCSLRGRVGGERRRAGAGRRRVRFIAAHGGLNAARRTRAGANWVPALLRAPAGPVRPGPDRGRRRSRDPAGRAVLLGRDLSGRAGGVRCRRREAGAKRRDACASVPHRR